MPQKKPRTQPGTVEDTSAEAQNDDLMDRDTVVMFVDIMSSSELSNYNSPKAFSDLAKDFQSCFKGTCKDYTEAWYDKGEENYLYNARGDEGIFMAFPEKDKEDIHNHIDIAINIALALKRRWISYDGNIKRIESGLLPIDLAIGIHMGKTYLTSGKKDPPNNPFGMSPEGYAINLAKRVESESRSGKYTRIFVSEAAHGRLNYLPDETIYSFDKQQKIVWVQNLVDHLG